MDIDNKSLINKIEAMRRAKEQSLSRIKSQ